MYVYIYIVKLRQCGLQNITLRIPWSRITTELINRIIDCAVAAASKTGNPLIVKSIVASQRAQEILTLCEKHEIFQQLQSGIIGKMLVLVEVRSCYFDNYRY